jgi:hypothetical protein
LRFRNGESKEGHTVTFQTTLERSHVMKRSTSMNCRLGWLTAALIIQGAALAAGNTATLPAPLSGDAGYAWNSKYGPYGYSVGGTELGVGLGMNGRWGNDYTVGIIEIPIALLHGGDLLGAQLTVNTVGNFGTGYNYGSVAVAWIDTGSMPLTGDVVADDLGALRGSMGGAGGWKIWDSAVPEGPMLKQFDVAIAVQADLTAGRAFSTFVLNGSRDTWGTIYAAESGPLLGPRMVAQTTAPVPEPGAWLMMIGGLGILGGVARSRFRA